MNINNYIVLADHATKEYVDLIVPEPPTTGNYTLQSANGTVS